MVPGGAMIPHNRPLITAEDRAAVDAVLTSGWIAQGPAVEALEADFVRRYSGGGACAVSSGTAALFLALKALGAGAGKKVAIPTYACSALLNAVYMVGASPVLVDVLPDSFCLNPAAMTSLAEDIAYVIAVHAFGAPADLGPLRAPGRWLVEDCCQSLGGGGDHGPLGCESDAAVFSFYATKIVTGGQGGLVWSKDASVTTAVRDYRQFDCRESYVPRFNLQMTDIQAALVNSQMNRLEAIRARRQAIAKAYLAVLPTGLSTQTGLTAPDRMPYRFVVITPDLTTREALRRHLEQAGIGCAVPIERYELLHRYLKLGPSHYPIAERLVDTALSLPIHPGMNDAHLECAVTALSAFNL